MESYEKQTISGDVEINVFTGEKVRFWGDNDAYSDGIDVSKDKHTSISSSGNIKIYGNIMSLIDSDGFNELKELTKPYTFKGLFATDGEHGNKYLTDASGLLLSATTLANSCYYSMFLGCEKLETAPMLPAETLKPYCYEFMFSGCKILKSLTCLATDISAISCTVDWLNGVAAEGTFTKAASMTGWAQGSSGIPSGWT